MFCKGTHYLCKISIKVIYKFYLCKKYQVNQTSDQYNLEVSKCRNLFVDKNTDYGTAWRILRTTSLTDQIFIKAQRIRTLEQLEQSRIDEGIEPEYIGIINYCILAIIQLELPKDAPLEMKNEIIKIYDSVIAEAKQLMEDKNHDYGEAWRKMRISSLTDLILMKLLRLKQLEDNDGMSLVSEGLKANYQDIINYAVFALIKLTESKKL